MPEKSPFLLPRSFIVLQVLGVVLVVLGALGVHAAFRKPLIRALPALANPRVAWGVAVLGLILLGLAVARLRLALKAWAKPR